MAEGWAVVCGRGRGNPVSVCLAGGRKAKSGQDVWNQMTKDLGPQRRGSDFVIKQSVGSYAISVRAWSNGVLCEWGWMGGY